MFGRERIEYKTPEQIAVMRRAGLVVADALDAVRAALAPGVTTARIRSVRARKCEAAQATMSATASAASVSDSRCHCAMTV